MDDAYGLYIYDKKIIIDKGMTQKEKRNVLLHEMCHHAVHTLDGDEYHHHGKKWKKRMKSCGFIGKITKMTF
jgi:predicted SprT family Zn-dependent metalloprotease